MRLCEGNMRGRSSARTEARSINLRGYRRVPRRSTRAGHSSHPRPGNIAFAGRRSYNSPSLAPSIPFRPSAMRIRILSLVAALAGAISAGCSSAAPEAPDAAPLGPAWFEEATAAYGLDFVHDAGPTGNFFTPQSVGSGGALLDFDNDGLLDLY